MEEAPQRTRNSSVAFLVIPPWLFLRVTQCPLWLKVLTYFQQNFTKYFLHLWKISVISTLRTNFSGIFRNLTTGSPEAPSPRGVAESESLNHPSRRTARRPGAPEEEAIEIGNS